MKDKELNKILIIVVGVLVLIVIAMGFYIVYNQGLNAGKSAVNNTPSVNTNTNNGNNTTTNTTPSTKAETKVVAKNTKFDYDGMQAKILDFVNSVKNTHAYLSTCKLSDDPNKSFDLTHKKLSNQAIVDVINKLKQASKVQEITTNVVCPGYTFSITNNIYSSDKSDLMSIIYVPNSENKKSLLVSIDVENYASSSVTKYIYSYDNESELDNFLENLKQLKSRLFNLLFIM